MVLQGAVAARRPAGRRVLTGAFGIVLAGGLVCGCGSSSKSSAGTTPSNPPTTAASSQPSSDSSSGPTSADLEGVLLTADQVSQIANGQFTASPSTSDDNSNTGCAALDDFSKASKDSDKAKAEQDYDTSDQSQSVTEGVVYVPDQAEELFSQLKSALGQCDSFTVAGHDLSLTQLDDPSVDGADDTLAAQASGDIEGQTFTVDLFAARFGDNVVQISYGGLVDDSSASSVGEQLLQQASDKGKDVLQAG